MTTSSRLSLPAAIFVNINVMMGTGIFINTVMLAKYTGALGGFLYPAAGALMLPLILCFAHLSSMQEQGNFYTFGAMISPFWGFINAWSYFAAKLASSSLSIHVFSTFINHVFPTLPVSSFFLDFLIILLFIILNTRNVKTGGAIQYGFVFMKALPFLFAIFAGIWATNWATIGAPQIIWKGLPTGLPLVLFCFLGFEVACSLSRVIENARHNASRVILISFGIMVSLAALYQLLFWAALSTTLAAQNSYVQAFPLLIDATVPGWTSVLSPLFSIAIATSALGGAYGIIYSNSWNLFALAESRHVIGWKALIYLNKNQIPTLCVVAEGIICCCYLALTHGAQIPLQYTATLGSVAAYTISTAAYLYTTRSLLGVLGMATCVTLSAISIRGFITTSLVPLGFFAAILLVGCAMYLLVGSHQKA